MSFDPFSNRTIEGAGQANNMTRQCVTLDLVSLIKPAALSGYVVDVIDK